MRRCGQHVLGALGITSADEVPEDLFPLFGKSSLVRFGRAKRWKYKRATKMFVEMLCWYTAPLTCRDRCGSGKTSTARATTHVGRVFQKYMPIGTFGTDKRGAPVFYSLPDVDIKGLVSPPPHPLPPPAQLHCSPIPRPVPHSPQVREIGFEAYERGSRST